MSPIYYIIINLPMLRGHLAQTNDFIQNFIFGLFKEFILQKEKRKSVTSVSSLYTSYFYLDTNPLYFHKQLWNCVLSLLQSTVTLKFISHPVQLSQARVVVLPFCLQVEARCWDEEEQW